VTDSPIGRWALPLTAIGIGRNRNSGVRRCPTFDRTAAALVVYVGYGTQCKTFDRTTAALVVYPVLIALWYNSRCVARVCGLMGARARIQLLNAQLESSESAIILCLCFVWGWTLESPRSTSMCSPGLVSFECRFQCLRWSYQIFSCCTACQTRVLANEQTLLVIACISSLLLSAYRDVFLTNASSLFSGLHACMFRPTSFPHSLSIR
jgi:hypothetical protein